MTIVHRTGVVIFWLVLVVPPLPLLDQNGRHAANNNSKPEYTDYITHIISPYIMLYCTLLSAESLEQNTVSAVNSPIGKTVKTHNTTYLIIHTDLVGTSKITEFPVHNYL